MLLLAPRLAAVELPIPEVELARARAAGAAPERRELPVPRFAPGQLIVRFESSVTAPVERVLASRASFAAATRDGSSSLDELFARFGVERAVPLAREPVLGLKADGAAPTAAELEREETERRARAAARFAERARRASADLVVAPLYHLYRLDLAPGTDAEEAARAFAMDPHVASAEPNRVFSFASLPTVDPVSLPNDALLSRDGGWRFASWGQPYANTWGLQALDWHLVWDARDEIWPSASRRGGKGVVVAVLDSGVDVEHRDLAANIWRDGGGRPGFDAVDIDTRVYLDEGWTLDPDEDYTTPDRDPADRFGHGTHVAGTIAAVADNGIGIAGVAWASKVMPVRVGFQLLLEQTAFSLLEEDDIVRGLVWAVEHGADVVNMSFGTYGEAAALEAAVAQARAAGVLLVAAAGNNASDARLFHPAAFEGVIGVAALDVEGRRAIFSNWGAAIDCVAPGVDVLSPRARDTALSGSSAVVAEDYIRSSGTSMASPHAAGVGALLLSAFPAASLAEIESRLVVGRPTPSLLPVVSGNLSWGFERGRLDAFRSLTLTDGPAVHLRAHGLGTDANGDGAVDPAEDATLRVFLANTGVALRAARIDVESLDPHATVNATPRVEDLRRGEDLLLDVPFTAAPALRWGQPNRFRVRIGAEGFTYERVVSLALRGPRQEAGWPVPASLEHDLAFQAPVLGNLDDDPAAEVLVPSFRGLLRAYEADGHPLPGWELQAGEIGSVGGLNAADLDGDGRLEVAQAQGRELYVVEHDGRVASGWPVAFASELRESPALADLDGDGMREVIAVEVEGHLHVLDHSGQPLPGWPKTISRPALAAPLVVDLDGGGPDILVATGNRLEAFHADGSLARGRWPAAVSGLISRAPAVVDFGSDGRPEIVALTYSGETFVLDAEGAVLAHTPPAFGFAISSPALGDIDGDGEAEIVVGGSNYDFSGGLDAYEADGQRVAGWPVRLEQWLATSPTLVDLDGDGALEVLSSSLDGLVQAFRGDGRPVDGWPYSLGAWASVHLVAGDLDGDGALEIGTTLARFFTSGFQPIATLLEFGAATPYSLPWPSGRGGATNPGAADTTMIFRATAMSSGVELGWSFRPAGVGRYRLERRAEHSHRWEELARLEAGDQEYFDASIESCTRYFYRLTALDGAAEGTALASAQASAVTRGCAGSPCTTGGTALCLQGGRFRLETFYANQHDGGGEGRGTPVPASDKSGYFWFFQPNNYELVSKVIDGTDVNGSAWVFYGALSNVEYWLKVIDRQTGRRRVYHNPPGEICGLADTGALPTAGASPLAAPVRSLALDVPAASFEPRGGCAGPGELCLLDRLRVSVAWRNQHAGGATGAGTAIPLTGQSGAFWFFNDANVELVLKAVDGRPVNGKFWIFWGALSNVEYTITVTDTATGAERTYFNPAGNVCGGADTGAL